MAIKATVYKAILQVVDIDRNYYADHTLTMACHPSETEDRLMVRVLAFALNASEHLAFGRGLSEDDEPALWEKDLTGIIELWIELGQPDEKTILRACGRSKRVLVYAYSANPDLWWNPIAGKLSRAKNLAVYAVAPESREALGKLARRSMDLQCSVQDGEIWMRAGEESVPVTLRTIRSFA